MSRMRIRSTLAVGATTVALAAGAFAQLGPVASNASSHREAPLTAADPQIDNTDVYAFVSPDKPNTVSFVSSWIPFEEPAGGPNFYTWAEHTNYDIKISNDGDAAAEITYRWNFRTHYRNADSFIYNNGPVTSLDDENLLVYQTYDLTRIKHGNDKKLINDALVAPSNVGARVDAELQRGSVRRRRHEGRRLPEHQQLGGPERRPVLPGSPRVRPALRRQPQRSRR